MKSIFSLIKRILGASLTKQIRPLFHGIKGLLAAIRYGVPARSLTIIGITGTKGKTSTTIYTGRLLNRSGLKAGYISTAILYDGKDRDENGDSQSFEIENPYKMTSIDSIELQRLLREMVDNGCTHVVVELSSQGLEQHRHWGMGKLQTGVFLNIYPEHIEAHGSYENYIAAKQILFRNLGKNSIFIGNADIPETSRMWEAVPYPELTQYLLLKKGYDYSIRTTKEGCKLVFRDYPINTSFFAPFEAVNIAFACKITEEQLHKKIPVSAFQNFDAIRSLPGRLDWVVQNGKIVTDSQFKPPKPFERLSIMVDYAHEPESMRQLLTNLQSLQHKGVYDGIIHIVSCDGVGRDDWKKPIMGLLSSELADYSVLTTDNYGPEDDPNAIIQALSKNIAASDKKHVFSSIHRRDAFDKALHLAYTHFLPHKKVLIVSTGVGNEDGLTQPGGTMPWYEKNVWSDLYRDFVEHTSRKTTSNKKSAPKAIKPVKKKAKPVKKR